MGIVDRSIQWIDVPLVDIPPRQQAGFFRDDLMSRKKALDLSKQECLGLVIHFGDYVDHAFIVHLVLAFISGT